MGMSAADPPTTIQVRTSTRRLLESYRIGSKTYDDVVLDLMEESPPETFFREIERRLRDEPDVPWERVRKRLKL
jgi:hypothetical protein